MYVDFSQGRRRKNRKKHDEEILKAIRKGETEHIMKDLGLKEQRRLPEVHPEIRDIKVLKKTGHGDVCKVLYF